MLLLLLLLTYHISAEGGAIKIKLGEKICSSVTEEE